MCESTPAVCETACPAAAQSVLARINTPADIRQLSKKELTSLCAEIRELLIRTVSENGGHLASNLGVVELTVALHKAFDLPQDKIIWDVGHQSYAHKILTGRRYNFSTLRVKNGISGFPQIKESEFDAFSTGHASTSISAALGLSAAKELQKEEGFVVSVIGDGALTGGLAYEGLNNAGRLHRNFIVILNDNEMSISRNVGSIARYLAKIRTRPIYLRVKSRLEKAVDSIPKIGGAVHASLTRMKKMMKHLVYGDNLFENFGFTYYGPFDGHDIALLTEVFENAKRIDRPVLLHILTTKGKGYSYAENNPGLFHGISGFDVQTGAMQQAQPSFSEVFGETVCEMARADPRLCAITAAMKTGTGLQGFARQFPTRFFDTGIAEEHAVTFSGALAVGGMLPVFAVYSTFLQRSYDQIIHDAAIQNAKVTLAIDRAGIVGDDGETHQGIFDAAFLNTVPGVTVYAPAYFEELRHMLRQAVYEVPGVAAVRYPRGGEPYQPAGFVATREAFQVYGTGEIAIVTYGRLFSFACLAREKLQKEGVAVQIIKLNRICPIDPNAFKAASACRCVFFFEEGILQGGIGESFGKQLSVPFVLRGIDNQFLPHAKVRELLTEYGLDDAGMVREIKQALQDSRLSGTEK